MGIHVALSLAWASVGDDDAPVLVRGGGKADLKAVLEKSAALMAQGAKGMVYGRNIYQHDNPRAVVAALMAQIHQGASGEEAWEIYNGG